MVNYFKSLPPPEFSTLGQTFDFGAPQAQKNFEVWGTKGYQSIGLDEICRLPRSFAHFDEYFWISSPISTSNSLQNHNLTKVNLDQVHDYFVVRVTLSGIQIHENAPKWAK